MGKICTNVLFSMMSCAQLFHNFFAWKNCSQNGAALCLNNYIKMCNMIKVMKKPDKYFTNISSLILSSTRNLTVNFFKNIVRRSTFLFLKHLQYTFGSSRCILKEHDFDLLQWKLLMLLLAVRKLFFMQAILKCTYK